VEIYIPEISIMQGFQM